MPTSAPKACPRCGGVHVGACVRDSGTITATATRGQMSATTVARLDKIIVDVLTGVTDAKPVGRNPTGSRRPRALRTADAIVAEVRERWNQQSDVALSAADVEARIRNLCNGTR